MKKYLGISAGFHDAAVSVITDQGDILFAGHAERYSKQKHDPHINQALMAEALSYGEPDVIAFYEKPWLKKLRNFYAGQYNEALDFTDITVRKYLHKHVPISFHKKPLFLHAGHHLSHAAAGFQTSPFTKATVVVIDAIGEWDTISIWGAIYDSNNRATYKKLWSQQYPHSIGLFYSAITKRVGLHPMDEEYITMGMAGWGKPSWYEKMNLDLVADLDNIKFKDNFHIGLDPNYLEAASNNDIAASAQQLAEELINNVMKRAQAFQWSSNLVYMGGVALNCLANRNLGEYFENIWIMPCPGDAGSSLGAAALAYGHRINWQSACLGTSIPGDYPVMDILDQLLTTQIVGVASGRAEFGPRALGNRSLLADPRGSEIKDKVNEIKRRQQFRPFAPVILEEHVHNYFDMPRGFDNSRYMQVIARCRHTQLFPAIVHIDGTSRVQTVPKDGSGLRELLEKWYALTGCPMLLNTSLNIRGEPMVNDRVDADRFEQLYGVKVVS
jgi:carbamoyltransferase